MFGLRLDGRLERMSGTFLGIYLANSGKSLHLEQEHSRRNDAEVHAYWCVLEVTTGQKAIDYRVEQLAAAVDNLAHVFLILGSEATQLANGELAIRHESRRG